ncbi:regucalcin isoform X2 [Fopius arisanus]|uniref:Regucalcin n=1 Tax=Fopius arisanus TaxID=64838 RepID=A0A0C9PVI0_9HYME|nr:PREDICTED: regucalcin-like isoform X2 [Fopius arisanus]
MASNISIEQVAGPYDLGEGPHWDEDNSLLYFVDIHAKKFFAFDPSTKNVTETYIKNGPVGVAVPIADQKNTFIAGAGKDLVEVQWDPSTSNPDPEVKVLSTVDADRANNRFNDGKVDPAGRFWAGTMSEKDDQVADNQGALYRFQEDGTPVKVLDGVTISNGLCWSHDNEIFYYIDSPTHEVVAYNYDVDSGDISNKRVIFNFKENDVPGVPDGMTIDKDGHLWVAVWDGARILEIDPETQKLLRTVTMPAARITSAAFGGPEYDVLYVTSAKHGLSTADLEKQPAAGYVFAIHGLGTSGVKPLNAKM